MATNLRFGEFRLDMASRQLWRGGRPVSLTARALDTLIVLLRNAGSVVTKETLISEVWADVIVDENNLNQQISLLRKILDDDRKERRYIETVPRKGFCFVAEVSEVEEGESGQNRTAWSRSPARLGLLLLVITAVAVLAAPALRFSATAPRAINRLAILPLGADPADPTLEHLRSGLMDDIGDRLRHEGALRILSPVSGSPGMRDAKEAAKAGGADAVLGGSLAWVDDNLEVALSLDDMTTGDPIWQKTYVTDERNLASLSSRVVAGLNEALGIEMRTRPIRGRAVEFEAYEAYLKGRYHWGRRTAIDFEKAISHYRRAIEIEPDYAEAHAGLAMVLGFSGQEVEARAVARRALVLDPSLADLRAFLALMLLHYDFMPELSRQEFERAVSLAPESATVRHWHSFYYSYTGQHDRALAEIRRAHALDPLSLIIDTDVGVILLYAGRFDEAIAELEEVLDLDPTYWNAHYYVALAYEQVGRYEEALAEWQSLGPSRAPEIPALVGLGRATEASSIIPIALQEVVANPETRSGRVALAQDYAALGDFDAAFEWLERAYEAREGDVMTLAVNPRFIPLRGDPRFAEMLHRLRLDTRAAFPSVDAVQ